MIDKTSSVPLYKQVANEILKQIKEKIYTAHQKIPSEYDLAELYGVSRLTVRKAVDYLAMLGYLYRQKKKGTYVTVPPKIESGKNGLMGFTESLHSQGKNVSSKVLEFTLQVPDQDIQRILKVDDKNQVFHISRVRYGDEEPYVIEETYVNARYCKGLKEENVEESLFQYIEKYIKLGYSHQTVEAIAASKEDSDLLGIENNVPLLSIHSTVYSTQGFPVLYNNSLYRSDKYKFTNTLTRFSKDAFTI